MNPTDSLPLLGPAPLDTPIAWQRERWIMRAEFLTQVARLAEHLPDMGQALILCADRYRFMVAFGAVLLRKQSALLPPSLAPRILDDIGTEYDAYRIDDAEVEAAVIETPVPVPHETGRRTTDRLRTRSGGGNGGGY